MHGVGSAGRRPLVSCPSGIRGGNRDDTAAVGTYLAAEVRNTIVRVVDRRAVAHPPIDAPESPVCLHAVKVVQTRAPRVVYRVAPSQAGSASRCHHVATRTARGTRISIAVELEGSGRARTPR